MRWLLIATLGRRGRLADPLGHRPGDRPGAGLANMYQTIVALLAALGAMLAGVACAGIAAIHGLTILLETTAGNDRMENWPNVGLFLDWVGDLWFVINTAAVSVALGLGVDWLLPGLLGGASMTVAITVFFVFPVLLLCTLETDSAFLPVSGVVLASLGRHGHRLAGVLLAGRQSAGGRRRDGLLSGRAD